MVSNRSIDTLKSFNAEGAEVSRRPPRIPLRPLRNLRALCV